MVSSVGTTGGASSAVLGRGAGAGEVDEAVGGGGEGLSEATALDVALERFWLGVRVTESSSGASL